MAKKNEARNAMELKCSVCEYILRPTEKNKVNTPDRLEAKKYCKKCKKVQIFKEKK